VPQRVIPLTATGGRLQNILLAFSNSKYIYYGVIGWMNTDYFIHSKPQRALIWGIGVLVHIPTQGDVTVAASTNVCLAYSLWVYFQNLCFCVHRASFILIKLSQSQNCNCLIKLKPWDSLYKYFCAPPEYLIPVLSSHHLNGSAYTSAVL